MIVLLVVVDHHRYRRRRCRRRRRRQTHSKLLVPKSFLEDVSAAEKPSQRERERER